MKIPIFFFFAVFFCFTSCGISPEYGKLFEPATGRPDGVVNTIDIQKSLQNATGLLTVGVAEQQAVCERSKTESAESNSIKIRLNRVFSMMLIPNCGSDIDTLNMLSSLHADIDDHSVKQFLAVLSGLVDRKIQAAIIEKNKYQEEIDELSEEVSQLREDRDINQQELKILQSKLEELKLIEQTLNKP